MQNKYQKYYNLIINYRKEHAILNGYYEVHHIIPKSLDGLNNTDNLIKLTAREHLVVHKLLKKITFILYGKESKQYQSMTYALWQMSNRDNNAKLYMSSREYEKLKIEFSQLQSKRYTGDKNPRYNKIVSQSTRDKISAANKGKIPWMKGKQHSIKSKELMSKNHADITGKNNPMYGKKHKPESIQKMKDHQWDRSGSKNPRYGKKLSKEEKQHLSKMLSGEKHPLYGKKRPEHSKKMSGKNNPAFGRKWMYNPITNEKVYSKKDDIQKYLNLGYIFGTGKKIKYI